MLQVEILISLCQKYRPNHIDAFSYTDLSWCNSPHAYSYRIDSKRSPNFQSSAAKATEKSLMASCSSWRSCSVSKKGQFMQPLTTPERHRPLHCLTTTQEFNSRIELSTFLTRKTSRSPNASVDDQFEGLTLRDRIESSPCAHVHQTTRKLDKLQEIDNLYCSKPSPFCHPHILPRQYALPH